MDTACLRIKFTPLLKGTEKLNSKCCLEIVPEVSYIQNFDKLTWNGATNYIEYTIPMKYKIILRKQQNGENIDDNNCKTYHSCVDLLLSTSKSNYAFASGDVSRMISDTFILNKTAKSTFKKDNFMNNLDDFNDATQSGTATYATITTLDLKDLPIEETEDELMNHDTRKSTPQQYCLDTVNMISCDKFTNTESISAVNTYDLDSDWLDQNKSGFESNARTLSVALMCSVNTQDTTKSSKSIVSKAITCNIYNNSQADVLLIEDLNTRSDLCNELQLNRMIAKFDDVSRISNDSVFSTCSNRSTPEVRIAQYVKYMKTELLPLNMFLDKLITKCSVLGINKNHRSTKPYSQNLVLYKSVGNSKNNSIESCENSISNRAVYSIVFNE